ncbi:MAG: hypothetical protein LBF85_03575, partial [Tannerella sp.]|nr:hypothetical protein [Tannerella sp.]
MSLAGTKQSGTLLSFNLTYLLAPSLAHGTFLPEDFSDETVLNPKEAEMTLCQLLKVTVSLL